MKKEQPKQTNHTEQQASERSEIDGGSHDSHNDESGQEKQNSHHTKDQETNQAPNINIYQPHDSFFKRYFRHPQVFISLVKSVVTPELVRLLDFSTLSFESDTYVDKQFRSHFSDLVATVMVKSTNDQESNSTNQATTVAIHSQNKAIKIYLLAEHKSYDDSKALLQISRYQHQLWEKDAKKNPTGYLTPVISILFHHGKSKLVPVSFHELFDPGLMPVFEEYIPEFKVALINLTALGIDEFPTDPSLAMAYWSMKYGRTQLKKVLEQLVGIWQGWEKLEDIDQYRDEVMEYLTTMNDLTMEEFVSIMESTLNEQLIREEFMFRPNTLLARHAKEHYEKGIQKGEQIGIQRGEQIGIEKGIQKGEQIGIEKGIQRGEQIGIQKGKQLGIEQGIELEKERNTKAQQRIIQSLRDKGFTEEEIEEMFHD